MRIDTSDWAVPSRSIRSSPARLDRFTAVVERENPEPARNGEFENIIASERRGVCDRRLAARAAVGPTDSPKWARSDRARAECSRSRSASHGAKSERRGVPRTLGEEGASIERGGSRYADGGAAKLMRLALRSDPGVRDGRALDEAGSYGPREAGVQVDVDELYRLPKDCRLLTGFSGLALRERLVLRPSEGDSGEAPRLFLEPWGGDNPAARAGRSRAASASTSCSACLLGVEIQFNGREKSDLRPPSIEVERRRVGPFALGFEGGRE